MNMFQISAWEGGIALLLRCDLHVASNSKPSFSLAQRTQQGVSSEKLHFSSARGLYFVAAYLQFFLLSLLAATMSCAHGLSSIAWGA